MSPMKPLWNLPGLHRLHLARLILEPLQEGRAVMASCDWRYSGDVAGEGFAKFLRGITRLSNSAKGDGGACVPSLLDWLDGDWTNLLAFFCSMHEAKRLSRSQVEMCVEKLRSLSVRFAEVEAGTKGLPWREASIEPLQHSLALRTSFWDICKDLKSGQQNHLPAMLVSRSLLKKQQGGYGLESKSTHTPHKPSGRAFRRQMLVTAIHRISESPMPTSSSKGCCFDGLSLLFTGATDKKDRSGRISDCEDKGCFDSPKKIETPLTDSDSETMSTMTRMTSISCTDCESLSA
eukprot:s474_g7.t1